MTNAEITAFLAVCQHKSLTRAAQALYISQSSLSTRLKTLEREVGCPLLLRQRGRQMLQLTPAGERFYRLALQYRELMEQMAAVAAEDAGRLRVSSINSIGAYLFPRVYEQFLQQDPAAELEIQDYGTDAVYRSMEQGLTDLAFVVRTQPSRSVSAMAAFSEPMVFVCSAAARYPAVVQKEDLCVRREVFIYWFEEFLHWHTASFGATGHMVQLEIMEQLQFFLTRRDAWAIVPVSVARGLLKNPSIARRQMAFPVPRRLTSCLFPSAAPVSASVRQFLRCLQTELTAMEADGLQLLDLFQNP